MTLLVEQFTVRKLTGMRSRLCCSYLTHQRVLTRNLPHHVYASARCYEASMKHGSPCDSRCSSNFVIWYYYEIFLEKRHDALSTRVVSVFLFGMSIRQRLTKKSVFMRTRATRLLTICSSNLRFVLLHNESLTVLSIVLHPFRKRK